MRFLCLFLLIIIFVGNSLLSQSIFDSPDFLEFNETIPEKYAAENEIYIFKNRKNQILLEEDGVFQYQLIHDRLKINTSESIERNNKIYIPHGSGDEIITTKLRVISPLGKSFYLQNEDINEEIDEETGVKYKYFAVSGLETGSTIEKIYLIKQNAIFSGKTLVVQDEIPIINYNFELIYPGHLEFKYKFYNVDKEPTIIDTLDHSKCMQFSLYNLDGLEDSEKYSNHQLYLLKFAYKLDKNNATGAKNINNYQDFAINAYNNINIELDKKSQKSIENFIKKIPSSKIQVQQIRKVEDYIKSQIVYNKYFSNNSKLADIFQSKQANLTEIVRLYVAIFRFYNIPIELVLTTKRFNRFFDKDFDSHENLDHILLYFPESNCYVDPLNFEYRTPLFNFTYGDNYGFFIKEKSFGGVKSGIGYINYITTPDSITHDYMNIIIDLTENIEIPKIHSELKFGGYSALNYQVIKDYVPNERYKNIIKDIAENYTRGGKIKDIKTFNDGCELLGIEPFILDLKFEGTPLVQKAGNTTLLKVGEIIGNQMELYETARNLPVEIYYKHYYTRKITIDLPPNMTIKNPEVITMNYKTVMDGKTTALFSSSYNIDDTKLIINNIEYYNEINYPIEHFEDYRKVINAAADFNKIVLILEPN